MALNLVQCRNGKSPAQACPTFCKFCPSKSKHYFLLVPPPSTVQALLVHHDISPHSLVRLLFGIWEEGSLDLPQLLAPAVPEPLHFSGYYRETGISVHVNRFAPLSRCSNMFLLLRSLVSSCTYVSGVHSTKH